MIASDKRIDITANAILAEQEKLGIAWRYIAPGKQMQNGLKEHLFVSLNGAGRIIEERRIDTTPTTAH